MDRNKMDKRIGKMEKEDWDVTEGGIEFASPY